MEIVYDLVVVLHFLGLASLIGGWLVQMRARGHRQVNPAMVHGALVQVITGLVLVGIGEAALDKPYDNAKLGVKLLVALAVLVLCWVNRRKPAVPDGLYFLVGGLAVGNVAVAVLW